MPAHALPLEVLELSGAFRKNPNRRPAGRVPKSDQPLGDPPRYFLPDERAAWREIITIIPPQVLVQSDRLVVEVTARLLAKFRRRDEGLNGPELNRLMGCLSVMGCTPADRRRITIADKPAEDFDFLQ